MEIFLMVAQIGELYEGVHAGVFPIIICVGSGDIGSFIVIVFLSGLSVTLVPHAPHQQ